MQPAQRPARAFNTAVRVTRGFTLVELLVVVSIIGLLISILLPALASARRSGQGVACQSNLRQLGIALDAYALENKNHYAPAAPGIATTNRIRWFGSRATSSGAFVPSGGPLSEHLGGVDGVRRCASLVTAGGGFERAAGGYGYNAAFVGTLRSRNAAGAWVSVSDTTGSPQARFMTPTETLAFADCALATSSTTSVIEYSFAEPDQWPDTPGFSPDPSIHFRHGGNARATASGSLVAQGVFLDGHVAQMRRGATSETSIYASNPAAAGLGWPESRGINALFDYE